MFDISIDGRLLMTLPVDENNPNSIVDALFEMPETCALDVAKRGGLTAQRVADILQVRRDTVEVITSKGLLNMGHGHEYEWPEPKEDYYGRFTEVDSEEDMELTSVKGASYDD